MNFDRVDVDDEIRISLTNSELVMQPLESEFFSPSSYKAKQHRINLLQHPINTGVASN